jgi:hypothetical protein
VKPALPLGVASDLVSRTAARVSDQGQQRCVPIAAIRGFTPTMFVTHVRLYASPESASCPSGSPSLIVKTLAQEIARQPDIPRTMRRGPAPAFQAAIHLGGEPALDRVAPKRFLRREADGKAEPHVDPYAIPGDAMTAKYREPGSFMAAALPRRPYSSNMVWAVAKSWMARDKEVTRYAHDIDRYKRLVAVCSVTGVSDINAELGNKDSPLPTGSTPQATSIKRIQLEEFALASERVNWKCLETGAAARATYDRGGNELTSRGLYIDLPAWA